MSSLESIVHYRQGVWFAVAGDKPSASSSRMSFVAVWMGRGFYIANGQRNSRSIELSIHVQRYVLGVTH
jgi:hypothetical protein